MLNFRLQPTQRITQLLFLGKQFTSLWLSVPRRLERCDDRLNQWIVELCLLNYVNLIFTSSLIFWTSKQVSALAIHPIWSPPLKDINSTLTVKSAHPCHDWLSTWIWYFLILFTVRWPAFLLFFRLSHNSLISNKTF